MDLPNSGKRKIADKTRFNGLEALRWDMINNFLSALTLNKKSLQNPNYYSGLGDLPVGKKFPHRPVQGHSGNTLLDILTNPDIHQDQRHSLSPELNLERNLNVDPIYNSQPKKKLKPKYE